MRYLSVCSGIEAATVAWHPIGWTPVAFAEVEKAPSQILAHHYPDVPNLGDMNNFATWSLPGVSTLDLLVGGTPCQSYSIAGNRSGLDDPRGNLMLTFVATARRFRPQWLGWENVPGVLSSNDGSDFGSLLGLLTGQRVHVPPSGWQTSGILPGYKNAYGVAWRVLDAQYFGVAQRRRRVFVVGCLGDWRPAAAVLFERQSLSGDSPPIRAPRQATTGRAPVGAPASDRARGALGVSGGFVPALASSLTASASSTSSPNVASGQGTIVGTLTTRLGHNAMGAPEVDAGHYLAWPLDVAPTSNAAFADKQGLEDQHALGGAGLFVPSIAHPLRAGGHDAGEDGTGRGTPLVASELEVRRLTPRECERLQGFPDDYTRVPIGRGQFMKDGPRYKALGNSMAVPVMRWIGERLALVSSLLEKE